ncbi:LRR receptor-like serine/threonine-protein kinase [Pyrus ussuriensis x Pyrus communis]|uniref:LRR receptor-like serine/threonine-protein kinase n=1 Tax=Pyrus ussuriensis x Pyrus communis TaxID=2448454 RepID=A0A5N5GGE5_9ROSA|nr:LRR receptor-like serine/threonine-protein kinase [Pyrus ussuriensis x Pyrus communis]
MGGIAQIAEKCQVINSPTSEMVLVGISPLSELLFNCRCCNLCRRLNSGGISWPKLLFWRSMTLKKLKFPTCGDIDPPSFKDHRLKLVTLL